MNVGLEAAHVARWWKEPYDAATHSNKMKGVLDGGYAYNLDETPRDRLIEKDVYLVEVCQFKFEFLSLRQLEIALEYFEKEHKGSTRIVGGIGAADHWEVQRCSSVCQRAWNGRGGEP